MGAIFKEGFSFSGYERDLLMLNLADEPIAARPPSTWYQVRKFRWWRTNSVLPNQ